MKHFITNERFGAAGPIHTQKPPEWGCAWFERGSSWLWPRRRHSIAKWWCVRNLWKECDNLESKQAASPLCPGYLDLYSTANTMAANLSEGGGGIVEACLSFQFVRFSRLSMTLLFDHARYFRYLTASEWQSLGSCLAREIERTNCRAAGKHRTVPHFVKYLPDFPDDGRWTTGSVRRDVRGPVSSRTPHS